MFKLNSSNLWLSDCCLACLLAAPLLHLPQLCGLLCLLRSDQTFAAFAQPAISPTSIIGCARFIGGPQVTVIAGPRPRVCFIANACSSQQ